MFKHKHKWSPLQGSVFVSSGKVYVVEYCKKKKCGMYRYIRVPSFAKLEEIEKGG